MNKDKIVCVRVSSTFFFRELRGKVDNLEGPMTAGEGEYKPSDLQEAVVESRS